jgi:hypothetical protein
MTDTKATSTAQTFLEERKDVLSLRIVPSDTSNYTRAIVLIVSDGLSSLPEARRALEEIKATLAEYGGGNCWNGPRR